MTTQACDSIHYKDEVHPLYSEPMTGTLLRMDYLRETGPISTARSRGYVCHWKIDDDGLFLVHFENRGIALSVPVTDLPIHATWFSGELRIQDGQEVPDDSHFEYGATYEREIVLRVESGCVVGSEIIDYQPSEMERLWRLHRANYKPCSSCRDTYRVCADHPSEPWPHGGCCGAEAGCVCLVQFRSLLHDGVSEDRLIE